MPEIVDPDRPQAPDWHEVTFDSFTTLKRGKDLTRDQFNAGDIPVAGSNGVIGHHDVANVKAPGVTVGRSGSVGRVAYYGRDFWAHNTALFVSDFHGNDARFSAYFLRHARLNRFASGVSVPTLDRNAFRLLPVLIPSVPEQRKIAAVLSLVQRTIEQQDRLLAFTSELKKALIQKLFTEGIRAEPQKQTEIGPVPQSWIIKALGAVARLQTGGTPSRDNPSFWNGGTIPWVKTTEVDYRAIISTEEMITESGLQNSAAKIFPSGTLLIAMYGQGITRGRVAILELDAATNQACAAISPFDEQVTSTRFIYYFLQHHYETVREMGHGANQKNLNMALLRGFSISYPEPREQAQIVSMLDAIDQKRSIAERHRAALQDLFRTLLHQLMTAQIRVNHLDLTAVEKLLDHA
jgi:type I restriction enzyme, S subunit